MRTVTGHLLVWVLFCIEQWELIYFSLYTTHTYRLRTSNQTPHIVFLSILFLHFLWFLHNSPILVTQSHYIYLTLTVGESFQTLAISWVFFWPIHMTFFVYAYHFMPSVRSSKSPLLTFCVADITEILWRYWFKKVGHYKKCDNLKQMYSRTFRDRKKLLLVSDEISLVRDKETTTASLGDKMDLAACAQLQKGTAAELQTCTRR